MKEKLQAMLATKLEQRSELNQALIDSDNKEERSAVNDTMVKVDEEIRQLQSMIADCDKAVEVRNAGEELFKLGGKEMQTINNDVEVLETKEYRNAFKSYMINGQMKEEFRASTKTTDTNIGTVIPTHLVNKIFEKYEELGTIYNLVTKTSYPVGVTIPTDGVKPTATWVGEGEGSTPVSKTLGAVITFSHHKLRCEIRYTQEVATMTLDAFEALFVKQVGEAMLRALEASIVSGTGATQPKGILTETPNAGQAIVVDAKTKLSYKLLTDVEAAIPSQYEGTTKWVMAKKTFNAFLAMSDANGQPIARVNYGIAGKPERSLLGREVVIYNPQAGSKLGVYNDNVTADTIFAFLFDFGDYVLNTNYNLGISHAQDWDNEDHKTKAVLACDGKVVVKDSLITLTKQKAAA